MTLIKAASTFRLIKYHQYINFSTCARKPSYLHHIGEHPLIYQNIGQTLDRAVDKFGDRDAIVSCHEKKRLTFRQVRDSVDKLAAGLLELGLKNHDAVAIWGPNNIQWYLTMLALNRVNLISVGLNPQLQKSEVEYCIQKVGVKAIVAAKAFRKQNYYEIIKQIIPNIDNFHSGQLQADNLPTLKSIIIDSEEELPGALHFDKIFSMASDEKMEAIRNFQSKISPDSPCNIQFTSGTTGKPKAVVLTHYGFVNNGYHVGNRNLSSANQHRICVQVPLFHAYGVVISIMAGLTHGATLVLPSDGFDPVKSLHAILNENCTVIHGTPTMYVDLINQQMKLKVNLKTAEIAVTGGAPCSPKLFKDIKNVLGLKVVKTVFGMTENTAVSFQSLPGEPEEHVLHTVGHLTDHIEAKVIDKNGEIVPFGQPGELCIRGYFNMLEYHGDVEKTLEALSKDRWLHTGDRFILEENGYGKIVGRLKDMIIRGGENISPKEIEDFLVTHPDIMEAYIIGVPDERMGEEVCAFVRLRDDVRHLDQTDVRNYFDGKIARFKIPKYVRVIRDFPRTSSGKIMKFKLKEIYENK